MDSSLLLGSGWDPILLPQALLQNDIGEPRGQHLTVRHHAQVYSTTPILQRPSTLSLPLIGDIKSWFFWYMETSCLEKCLFSDLYTSEIYNCYPKPWLASLPPQACWESLLSLLLLQQCISSQIQPWSCTPSASAAPTSSSKYPGLFNSGPWQNPKQRETLLLSAVDLSPPPQNLRTNYLASSWSLLSFLPLAAHCVLRLDEVLISLESIWDLTI